MSNSNQLTSCVFLDIGTYFNRGYFIDFQCWHILLLCSNKRVQLGLDVYKGKKRRERKYKKKSLMSTV